MNEDILTKGGLTPEQAKIYLCLLRSGLMPVKVISVKTGLGRSLTYKILNQLISLGAVEQRDNIAKITYFYPEFDPNEIPLLLSVILHWNPIVWTDQLCYLTS